MSFFFKRPRRKAASKEEIRAFRDQMSDKEITVKDRFAMLIAAFLVVILPCLLILILLGTLMLWLFGAFS